MVILFRHHAPPCEQKSRTYTKCSCAIYIDWRVGTQRIRKSLKTRNWQKAVAEARRIEMEGLKKDQPSPPIADATERYLADAQARNLREPTIYKFKLLFRQLEAYAQDKGLVFISDFDVDHVRQFRQSWTNRNFAARKKLEALRSFFRFCHGSGGISTNPAAMLKPGKTQEPEITPFTADDIAKILKACDEHPHKLNRIRLRALVLLMRSTGIRIRDAVTLSRQQIQGGKLFLRTAKTGTKVFCPLPPDTLQALDAINAEGQYYFWTGKSKPISAVSVYQEAFKKVFDAAGVRSHPHNFRHTFATGLLSQGVPLETVAVLLGHRSARITEKHNDHWIAGRQENLEDVVRKSWAILGFVS